MPRETPETKIEAALKRAAAHRRTVYGSARSMPEWLRGILQREAAERYARREQPRRNPFAVWLRWAGAFALVAIVVGVPIALRDHLPRQASRSVVAEEKRAGAAGSGSGSGAIEGEERTSRHGADRSAPVAAPATTTGAVALEPESAPAEVASAATAPAPALADRERAAASLEEASDLRLNFAQRGKDADKSSGGRPTNVLRNFEMTIAGNAVTFADQDGSQYRGRIVPAATEHVLRQYGGAGAGPPGKPLFGATADGKAFAGGAGGEFTYYFRASGENRTVGKRVVFEGTLKLDDAIAGEVQRARGVQSVEERPADEATPAPSATPAPARAAAGKAEPGRQELLKARVAPPARISGNALVNGSGEVVVDAVETQ